MYEDIKNQIQVLKKKSFSGHVRFGVMHGEITSIFMGNWNFDGAKSLNDLTDIDGSLRELCHPDYFGNIEYDFDNGIVTNFSWTESWAGPALQQKLKDDKCKSVRVVVKR